MLTLMSYYPSELCLSTLQIVAITLNDFFVLPVKVLLANMNIKQADVEKAEETSTVCLNNIRNIRVLPYVGRVIRGLFADTEL